MGRFPVIFSRRLPFLALALLAGAGQLPAQFGGLGETIALRTLGTGGLDLLEGFLDLGDGTYLVGGIYSGELVLPDGGTGIALPWNGGQSNAFAARLDASTGSFQWAFTIHGENAQQGFQFLPLSNGNFFIRGTLEGPGFMGPVAPGVASTFDSPTHPHAPVVNNKGPIHRVRWPAGGQRHGVVCGGVFKKF